ncbi:selenocysteine-specific translation elongation factor [uncultured Photobacterium sp.]|uniref:selenocysteine-specific translation elongation factor n=1 Tax=uncultured Photobacterium sp. TaxID=173973 RepID=UPI00261E792E|nr:selenocysteine-specific translation elongation factor [uncultured Photobacterium sp.]
MIIVTAGHVDHGKTHLLQALTDTNTDRLPEEQKRGLTIDLGYAFMPLPANEEQQTSPEQIIGFIDVPGHEKFLSNMLAGVGTARHALFVVASDEGLMPQSYEHLTILRLLAIESLTVVLTKSDKTTAEQQLARATEVENALIQYGFTQWDLFTCSAYTGQGIAELKQHLCTLATRYHQQLPDTNSFRLAIDRAFTVKGAGLVVTGTALNGKVEAGDQLYLACRDSHKPIKVRIRSLHSQGKKADHASADQRVALNLVGDINKEKLSRGDWLFSLEPQVSSPRITVKLTAEQTIKHWQQVQVFHVASHTTARIALLEQQSQEPGQTGLAELIFDTPLHIAEQDKLLIRDPAAKISLGSATAIDLLPPNRGKRKPERLEQLNQRAALTHPKEILLQALHNAPVNIAQFCWQHQLSPEHLSSLEETYYQTIQNWLCIPSYLEKLELVITNCLEQYHQTSCDHIGVGRDRLHRMAALTHPKVIVDHLLQTLIAENKLCNTRGWLHLPQHQLQLTQEEQTLWRLIEQQFRQVQGPLWIRDLALACQHDEQHLRQFSYKLAQLGFITAIVKDRYCTNQTLVAIADVIRLKINEEEKLETAEFRNITGLGRKVAIQLLEYFDQVGFTKRHKNYRLLRDEGLFKD